MSGMPFTSDRYRDPLRWIQGIVLVGVLLYFGQGLLVPMFFGLLIAIVVYPICRKLESAGLGRPFAIAICLAAVMLLFTLLLLLLSWQISLFRQDMPQLFERTKPLVSDIREWLSRELSITVAQQDEWLHNTISRWSADATHWAQVVFSATVGTLFALFIIPIHAALFLYHRRTFVRFLRAVAGERYRLPFDAILKDTIHTYFHYIKGMLLVYLIVGVLNSIGLMALGIRHAILFGMLTAIMTIIPYVGIVVSALLPISVAFITKDSVWYPVGVVAVFSFVQYLEANVIFPKVVGTQLNVSTWATLVAIIAGGLIWGVSGMILFIPFVAILKIVSDHVQELRVLNILLNRKI